MKEWRSKGGNTTLHLTELFIYEGGSKFFRHIYVSFYVFWYATSVTQLRMTPLQMGWSALEIQNQKHRNSLKTERNRRPFLSCFDLSHSRRDRQTSQIDSQRLENGPRLNSTRPIGHKFFSLLQMKWEWLRIQKECKHDEAWKHIENLEDTNWKIMEDSSMETRHSHGSRGRCGNLESNTWPTFAHIHHIPGCNFKTQWTTISAACHSIQHRWRPASSLLSTTRNSLGKSVQNWYLEAKAKSHEDIDKVHPARVWSHDSIYGQPDVWFDFYVSMDVSQICHWRWKQNMSRGACCAVPKVDSPQTNPEQLAHKLRRLIGSEGWPRATRRMSSRFPGQPSTLKAPFEGRKISLVSPTVQYPCKILAIAPGGSRILIVAYYLFL